MWVVAVIGVVCGVTAVSYRTAQQRSAMSAMDVRYSAHQRKIAAILLKKAKPNELDDRAKRELSRWYGFDPVDGWDSERILRSRLTPREARIVQYHDRMSAKYLRLIHLLESNPWVSVAPDPPEPK
jgi:hypothetical protein